MRAVSALCLADDRTGLGRAVAEHHDTGVVLTNADRTICAVNGAFARMLGFRPEELEGTAVTRLVNPATPGDSRLFEPHAPAATVATTLRHRQGHLVRVLLSVSPTDNGGTGETTGHGRIGVAMIPADHNPEPQERRHGELQTRAQRHAIQTAVAGRAGQDFAALLRTVLDNADMALLDLDNHGALLARLQRIRETAQHAAELSQQMLACSGKERCVVWETDLNTVLREMEYTLRSATPRAINIRFELDPGPPIIKADTRQLKQVVMNLVANASEAIGGREGTICLATGQRWVDDDELEHASAADVLAPGWYAFLEIADDGCGIPVEDRQRVFEPFFTTKRSCHGLGLPAALGVLRAHQGAIKLDSEHGRGSRFTLLLPAAAALSSDPPPSGGS